MTRTALVGGQVIDGSGGPALLGGTVVIDGSKILEVGQGREFGSETHVVDVIGMTVMPGLIDCHQHFGPWFQFLISQQEDTLMFLACKTVDFLRGSLESGCTTARDMGGLEAGFVKAVAKGLIPGPRLKTALVIIQPTNGITDNIPGIGSAVTPQGLYAGAPGIPSPWCNGPYQCRAKVRETLRYGADFIKIANEGFPDARYHADRPLFTQEELGAIIDEAHRAGVPVSAHAYTQKAVMMVLRAGVDSIEEGCFLDQVCVDEMAKLGTWYVPCLSNPRHLAELASDDRMRDWNKLVVEGNRRAFRLAMEAGVPIAMGTDSAYAVGETALELKWMVEAGMSTAEAIATSTGRAAQFLGVQDDVGILRAGREADLLVIDGDPLRQIDLLADIGRLALVMQAGVGISGRMAHDLPQSVRRLPRRTMTV